MDDRINYYLGKNIYNYIKKNDDEFITINDLTETIDVYKYLFIDLLKETNNDEKKFKFKEGDIEVFTDEITLIKNRCEGNENGVILRCLEKGRHWDNYYNKPNDIPFHNKKNAIFWRGTTTGREEYIGNRFELVKKWFHKNQNIDVGFSFICQGKEAYEKYVLGISKEEDFLNYKYILSVRGNDKDSGLQWKLNSNSLVLMPKPRIVSWLMESTLIPNVHYIELQDDFSDLEEKLHWCNNNQDKCEEIIKNANLFMEQFKDEKKEEELEKAVINKYFSILQTLH